MKDDGNPDYSGLNTRFFHTRAGPRRDRVSIASIDAHVPNTMTSSAFLIIHSM